MSVEDSKNRIHIQARMIDTIYDAEGTATYKCKAKHPGIPNEIFITGSRKVIRKHVMSHPNW